jgi:hypothetical protein
MERRTLFDSRFTNEALKLQEELWQESATFFRNFKIQEEFGLEGFQNLIFEASFAQCLAQKRIPKESLFYPIFGLIPKRFRPSRGIFQKTADLLHLNNSGYIDDYQESLSVENKEEKITPREIMSIAHLLSSVYLENLGEDEGKLKQAISTTINGSPFKKKAAQE